MSMKCGGKPPLAKSPVGTRPRRAVPSATSVSVHNPPGSLRKSAVLVHRSDAKEMDMKPEFTSIACEMRALTKMVNGKNETVSKNSGVRLSYVGVNKSPLFERGRFYDLYSARRNERLRRKLGIEMEDENLNKCCIKYDLGVEAGTMKRRDSKILESRRKSLPMDIRSQPSRYSLRSSKDNTKPLSSTKLDGSQGVDSGEKKTGFTRRAVRKV